MEMPGRKIPPGSPERKWIADFAPFLTIGMQLAFAVVGFFFLGRWLDGAFDTAPWLMIVGLLFGTTGGFIAFFRAAMLMAKKEDELRRKSSENVRRED